MNDWVEKSIRLAKSKGYLDRLWDTYPASARPTRPLDEQTRERIRSYHGARNISKLMGLLIKVTKDNHPFPIEHPYASIFRQRPELMRKNPRVLKELGSIILSMPAEDIVKGIERPIDVNRGMGQAFHRWLKDYFPKHGKPVLSEGDFEISRDAVFLDAGDKKIKEYVSRALGHPLSKGRDFLYKSGKRYVIGEARFLTTGGGSQTRDLRETVEFIHQNRGTVMAVGVIDGIVWFDEGYISVLSELGPDEPAFSVLLLEKFLDSVR
jgi:hypothetical protein